MEAEKLAVRLLATELEDLRSVETGDESASGRRMGHL